MKLRLKLALLLIMLAARGMQAALLWRIDAPGARSSYLLGTCHAVALSYADSISGFSQAFEQVTAVYTEIGLPDAAAMTEAAMTMAQTMAAQPPLGTVLPDSLILQLTQFIIRERAGADSAVVAADVAGSNLLQLMIGYPEIDLLRRMAGGTGAEPMDMSLAKAAVAGGKNLEALETPQFQMELMADFLVDNTAALIDEMLADNSDEELARLVTDYKSGELERFGDEFERYRGLPHAQRMLGDRNFSWVAALDGPLRQGGVLIAVGSGHLVGADGLIQLLRDRGFALMPIEN